MVSHRHRAISGSSRQSTPLPQGSHRSWSIQRRSSRTALPSCQRLPERARHFWLLAIARSNTWNFAPKQICNRWQALTDRRVYLRQLGSAKRGSLTMLKPSDVSSCKSRTVEPRRRVKRIRQLDGKSDRRSRVRRCLMARSCEGASSRRDKPGDSQLSSATTRCATSLRIATWAIEMPPFRRISPSNTRSEISPQGQGFAFALQSRHILNKALRCQSGRGN